MTIKEAAHRAAHEDTEVNARRHAQRTFGDVAIPNPNEEPAGLDRVEDASASIGDATSDGFPGF